MLSTVRSARLLPFRWCNFCKPDAVAIGLCVAAAGFLLSGSCARIREYRLDVSTIRQLDAHEPAISGTGFSLRAHYGVAAPLRFEQHVEWYGSWPGTFASVGTAYSAWYPAVPEFYLSVAGYPDSPGNQLAIEVQTSDSRTVRIPAISHNPGEVWQIAKISLREIKNAAKFRISATDGTTGLQGWLAFTQPFLIRSVHALRIWKQIGLVALATAASLVFFLAPGLVLRQKLLTASGRKFSFVWVPVPGVVVLALLGLAAWFGPQQLPPALISRAGLSILLLYFAYQFVRTPLSAAITATEARVLLVVLALTVMGVAKAEYSLGPAGELFGGSISRTLEAGERSDPTFPYAVAKFAAARKAPYGELGRVLNGGWSFSSRGPVAGLAATPIVLAGPAHPNTHLSVENWMVFDPEGYSTYRIAMIAMIVASLPAVFGLAEVFLSEQWSFLAFLLAATAPFVVHDIYFTWPKLMAASYVLLAAYLILQRRYLFGGLALGFGYLCHPSALIWVVPLAAVVFLARPASDRKTRSVTRTASHWVLRTALMGVGIGVCLLFWRIVNGTHYTQESFLQFFTMSGAVPPTFSGWLRLRYHSLVITLLPLDLFFFHQHDPGLHSIYGSSPGVIPFFFQYWNTLPFGAGIAFFFCLIRLMYVAFRKTRAWLLLVFVVPFLFFDIYMGWPVTRGLMREGLQAWFLGLMVFAAVIWKKYLAQAQTFWRLCNWALLFRGVEILAMLLVPTIWSEHIVLQRQFFISDVIALAVMIAATAWLAAFTFRFAEKLRVENRTGVRAPAITQQQSATSLSNMGS